MENGATFETDSVKNIDIRSGIKPGLEIVGQMNVNDNRTEQLKNCFRLFHFALYSVCNYALMSISKTHPFDQ